MAIAVSLWSPVIIDGANVRGRALRDGFLHALARRVDHPDETEEREVLLELVVRRRRWAT